jgi:hypothetical protein
MQYLQGDVGEAAARDGGHGGSLRIAIMVASHRRPCRPLSWRQLGYARTRGAFASLRTRQPRFAMRTRLFSMHKYAPENVLI